MQACWHTGDVKCPNCSTGWSAGQTGHIGIHPYDRPEPATGLAQPHITIATVGDDLRSLAVEALKALAMHGGDAEKLDAAKLLLEIAKGNL